jgi:RND family efflux transporter MFP subunit
MAAQKSGSAEVSGRFLANLLREREVAPRAALIAQQATELLPGAAAVIYLVEDQESPRWIAKATAGEIRLEEEAVPLDAGTLGVLAEQRKPLLFPGSELTREDYAHLHARRTLLSLSYVPIVVDEELIGALEVATFDGSMDPTDLAALAELVEPAGPALASALAYERERNSHLQSISRLAQLYDLEKVFNSTLEMDTLLPIVTSKFCEILEVQAVNLWMVKDEHELLLLNRAGQDLTIAVGSSQKSGEGAVAEVSDSGEPKLISDPEDEYLKKRNRNLQEGAVFSLMAAPLVAQGSQVGVIEAINKREGTPFDEDDLFLLVSMAETAAGAIGNAGLLQAERKVQILETLVKVSTEITSTLNLDRVLQTVVNVPGAVIPYERAAIALDQRGKLQLKAVSGMTQSNPGDPEVERLKQILQWSAISNEAVFVTQHGEEINSDREETRSKFQRYFEETGMRAFYALPLADDEGRVGILSMESSDPDFLGPAHLEMIQVLGAQATVALRNASLYKEVPFIGVLEPLIQKKRKFLALDKQRRTFFLAVAAAAILFLALFPLPMRVDGNATVGPGHTAQIQPEIDGVVRQVYVREGQHVQRGAVLADLEDWEYRTALAGAQAKYETANSEMNRALALNDGAEAGIQRALAAYWGSEVERGKERLEKTHLRALFDGWITTPHVEDFAGRHLAAGDNFAEIVDSSQATVDVAIDEQDVSLAHPGASGAVKLDSFPTRTFRGNVVVVSPKNQVEGDQRYFYARVNVPNGSGSMRPGMQGRGKISVGWRPVGYVLFRRPAMWIYSKFWSWLGW